MYAPTLSPAKHILLHNNPSLINQQQKPKCLPDSKFGFFGSSKRMCNYALNSRKAANLYVVRCSASQIEQQGGAMQGVECDDGYYMRRCVELAKKAIGHTSPNPMVGCVIVKDGKIVGEGFHPKAGQPHAEVFALRDAGDLAESATAYVSLEPCNHYGRTPPCTEALIKAKVKNVVIGMVDPNPIVASTGIKKLEDSCIKVRSGVEEEMCKRLNEAYIHYMLIRKPFVALRYSISLDVHMLNNPGEEATQCGGYYSRLLQEYDAIVLSSMTLSDKSSFPVSNEVGAKQPLKIVLSKHNSPKQIPNADSDSASNVIIFSEDEAGEGTVEPRTVQEGIKTISSHRINLVEILNYCKDQGLCSVLIELSRNKDDFDDLLKEGFEHSLFQKVVVEVLPVLVGGDCDKEREINHSNIKVELKKLTSSEYGKSVLLEGYF